MLFDTHAHYDDACFDEDREGLIKSLQGAGIGAVTDIASDPASVPKVLALAESYDFFYAAIGIHPGDCASLTEDDVGRLTGLCAAPKVVAVGEIGLDYHYAGPPREIQQKWFRRQLAMAREAGLPVVIHSRDAAQDTLDILKEEHAEELGGVIHCYSYSGEMAREFIRMGFFIGIGGVLTYKTAKKLKEVAGQTALEHIVLETDCPYLAPEPHRGKRNSSLYLPDIAAKLAEIKRVDIEEIAEATTENARRLYRLAKDEALRKEA